MSYETPKVGLADNIASREEQRSPHSPMARRGAHGIGLVITPGTGFALGALVVAALALAVAFGRHYPIAPQSPLPQTLSPSTIDQARRLPPRTYEQLEMDLGQPLTESEPSVR